MDETMGTPALNKALAAMQAELPRVGKGETGEVKGVSKDTGKAFSYTYKYANLAEVSYAVLPLLGKHGLAFTAKPTLNAEGKFVLAYSLRHESGEHDDGEFPLGNAGTPQQTGSLITYARRYSLSSVTGVAPDTDDDDGAAAQQSSWNSRSAGDAWERAVPASPRGRQQPGNGHQPASDAEGQAAPQPDGSGRAAQPAPVAADDELLGAWAAKLDEITSQADAEPVLEELERDHKGGIIDSRRYQVIRGAIRDKVKRLGGTPKPAARVSATERGAQAVPVGNGDDGEWVQGWQQRLADATTDEALGDLQRQIGPAVAAKKISPAKSADLSKAVKDRRSELEQVPA